MVFLICAALLLAGQANADHGWKCRASNKQDAMGQSSGFGAKGPNDAQLNDMWADFKQTYNRTYASPSEEAAAKTNFRNSMQHVFKVNRNPNSTHWATGNKFSDQDRSKLKARLMQLDPLTESHKPAEGVFMPEPPPSAPEPPTAQEGSTQEGTTQEGSTQEGPTQEGSGTKRVLVQTLVDWRTKGKVPAVRDQGECGSCWAFAATATIESAYLISKGLTITSPGGGIHLSEQHLVSCATRAAGYYSGGCNGGFSDYAMRYAMDWNQTTADKYPYTSTAGDAGSCLSSIITSTAPGQVVQLASGNPVYFATNSEPALRAAVDRQPVVVYFMAADSFYDYAGGIYRATDCTDVVNHAMVVVGYSYTGNPATDYWIVRNSWGEWWGDAGYVKIAMDGSATGPCGMYRFNVAPSFSFTQTLANVTPANRSPPPPPPPPSPKPPSPRLASPPPRKWPNKGK